MRRGGLWWTKKKKLHRTIAFVSRFGHRGRRRFKVTWDPGARHRRWSARFTGPVKIGAWTWGKRLNVTTSRRPVQAALGEQLLPTCSPICRGRVLPLPLMRDDHSYQASLSSRASGPPVMPSPTENNLLHRMGRDTVTCLSSGGGPHHRQTARPVLRPSPGIWFSKVFLTEQDIFHSSYLLSETQMYIYINKKKWWKLVKNLKPVRYRFKS